LRVNPKIPELAEKSVLIVDDNETSRFILSHTANQWGMLADTYASGADALSSFKRNRKINKYDIAIIDFDMPEINGVELAQSLRSFAPDLPIILLSSMLEAGKSTEGLVDFWLYKPVKKAKLLNLVCQVMQKPVRIAPPLPILAEPSFSDRPFLRILLVEDNIINQKVATRMLERIGYEAEIASNGVEAIAAVKQRPFDVIFMDVQMPVMDGLEATRNIREMDGPFAQPWIIAMTADVVNDAINACLEAGMNDFISKPTTINTLAKALKATAQLETTSSLALVTIR
jgi:CheY-like chemotaxis protein